MNLRRHILYDPEHGGRWFEAIRTTDEAETPLENIHAIFCMINWYLYQPAKSPRWSQEAKVAIDRFLNLMRALQPSSAVSKFKIPEVLRAPLETFAAVLKEKTKCKVCDVYLSRPDAVIRHMKTSCRGRSKPEPKSKPTGRNLGSVRS